MKKFLRILGTILIVCFIATTIFNKADANDKKAMNFPEPPKKNGCLGLNYHRIRDDKLSTKILESLTNSDELKFYSIYENEFRNHIETLVEKNVKFVTPDDIRIYNERGQFPDNCVWISFDDVDTSVYENAFPILKEYNIPFTLFLIAGQVGNDNYENLNLADWNQIQEMVDSGLANIGSHTYDMHYMKNNTPVFFYPEEQQSFLEDLLKSKETIETNLHGVKVIDFAYPFGEGSDELVEIIKEAGFQSANILAPRIIDENNNPYWQNRIIVDHNVFKDVIIPWLDISTDSNLVN